MSTMVARVITGLLSVVIGLIAVGFVAVMFLALLRFALHGCG